MIRGECPVNASFCGDKEVAYGGNLASVASSEGICMGVVHLVEWRLMEARLWFCVNLGVLSARNVMIYGVKARQLGYSVRV